MAVGYGPDGSVAPLTDLGWLSPAGQMYSTAYDLAKVHVVLILGGGGCNRVPITLIIHPLTSELLSMQAIV